MTHEDFMRKAIELSREQMNVHGDAPFAAIIVRDGEIVGEGCNRTLNNNDPTAHGEVEAIRDACRRLGTWDLSGCTLYTSCEPCQMCVAAMYWARIDKLYYANTLGDCEALGYVVDPLANLVAQPCTDGALAGERILGPEAHAVFEEWSRHPNFNALSADS